MSDGDVIFEIRGDNSKLEGDLRAAEALVQRHANNATTAVGEISEAAEGASERVAESMEATAESVERLSEATEEAAERTEEYREETEQTQKQLRNYSEELEDVNKLLEKDGKNSTLLAQKKDILTNAIAQTADKFRELKQRQEQVNTEYKNGNMPIEEYRDFQRELISAEQELDRYCNELNSMGKASEEAAASAESSGSKIGTSIAAGVGIAVTAIGTLAAAVGTIAVGVSNGLDIATNQVTASLGLSKETAEEYRDTIKQIYSDNYGESFEDIANSIGLIKQQITGITDDELVKATEDAYLLADVYGIDVSESIRGVNAMINKFGISAEEAYNLIAQGAEKGLNQNGDLADQLSEYATYYSQLGFSAEDALNMMSTAAEHGVFQIDYLNDAIKEFGIRAIDGSDTTAKGFAALGLDADKLAVTFAAGGQEASDAFTATVQQLAAMDDEIAQDAAGVALFGTKWEDLGKDAILALANTNDAIDSTRDKMSEMNEVKYESLSDSLENAKRNIELLIEPLGAEIVPIVKDLLKHGMEIATDVIPKISEMIIPLLETIGNLIMPIVDFIAQSLPSLLELAVSLIEPLTALVAEMLPSITAFIADLMPRLVDILNTIMPVLISIMSEIFPVIMELLNALLPILDIVITLLQPILDLVMKLLQPILKLISSAVTPLVKLLVDLIQQVLKPLLPLIDVVSANLTGVFGTAISFITNAIDNLRKYLSGIIDFVTGVFTGDWEKAWGGIKKIFESIFGSVVNVAEVIVNALIDTLNCFINGVNTLLGWAGVTLEPLQHVDWTATDAEQQALDALSKANGKDIDYGDPMKSMAARYAKQGKAESDAVNKQPVITAASNITYSAGKSTFNIDDYTGSSAVVKNENTGGGNDVTAKAVPTSANAVTTKSSGGNVVNITSYIPTVWDDAATANAKLAKGLGASIVGNSVSGKLISGNLSAGTSAAAQTSAAKATTVTNRETTLTDVVTAVKTLDSNIKSKKISLDVTMKARNLTIGKVAVDDINEITKAQGYSPLEG